MFTGIVDHVGKIESVETRPGARRFAISCEFSDLSPGESIAVDGACLTVTDPGSGLFFVDVSPETLGLTVAVDYGAGTKVNLERAMCLSDRLGGHLVTGHVDARGKVIAKETVGEYVTLVVGGVRSPHHRYLLKKGSVALQGVSLTVNEVTADGFAVMLIPHTLSRTTLGRLAAGSLVNLELDWMTKVILNDAGRVRSLLTEEVRS